MNTEKLLRLIENNAKLTNAEIAVMLGSTESEVSSKIKELEKINVIKGYNTVINWDNCNIPYTMALIEVKVTPQKDTGFDDIAKRISQFPEVTSLNLMSGGYDLSVMVSAPTMAEVAMFVRRNLATIEGVLSTATHFILTKYKENNTQMISEFEEIDERESSFSD